MRDLKGQPHEIYAHKCMLLTESISINTGEKRGNYQYQCMLHVKESIITNACNLHKIDQHQCMLHIESIIINAFWTQNLLASMHFAHRIYQHQCILHKRIYQHQCILHIKSIRTNAFCTQNLLASMMLGLYYIYISIMHFPHKI